LFLPAACVCDDGVYVGVGARDEQCRSWPERVMAQVVVRRRSWRQTPFAALQRCVQN